MSSTRVALAILVLSLVSAGVLGWVSRAPAEVRARRTPPGATDPELGARFGDEDVERHAAYRGPAYLYLLLSNVVTIGVLLLLAAGPLRRVVDRVESAPWPVQVLAAIAFVILIQWIASLPLGYVRGFAMEKAWGLSTQDSGGWLSDQLRSTTVSLVTVAAAALAFFALVRWQPRLWWLVGWAAFTLLTVALTILWPVLVAPLFNRFTPLQDPDLERRALALAAEAGIEVDRVLVADASRRTSTENAYVAGLGRTKQLVLYDNLVAAGDEDAAAFVIAHELGHRVERHIVKQVAIASLGLLIGFLALRALAGWDAPWTAAGSSGVGDPRAVPVLILFALVAGLVVLPVESAISRRFETRADEIALSLTDDPPAAVRAFRRLAFANIADLRPHPAVVALLYSHPPLVDRIDAALSQNAKSP